MLKIFSFLKWFILDNEKLNLELVNDKYSSFMKRLDLTLLGMGSDGAYVLSFLMI